MRTNLLLAAAIGIFGIVVVLWAQGLEGDVEVSPPVRRTQAAPEPPESAHAALKRLGLREEGGERQARLQRLRAASLTTEQLADLLGRSKPDAVLVALERIERGGLDESLRATVEKVADPEHAQRQFRNGFGHRTSTEQQRWDVRVASGRVLGWDLASESRQRAREQWSQPCAS